MNESITPPAGRTVLGKRLSVAAADSKLELPVCGACGAVQYPPREVCRTCLGDDLVWAEVDGRGEVLATVDLHHSLEPWFNERLPWPIASVNLKVGGVVFVHIAPQVASPGSKVRLLNIQDASGQGVLYAVAEEDADMDRGELETVLREYRVES